MVATRNCAHLPTYWRGWSVELHIYTLIFWADIPRSIVLIQARATKKATALILILLQPPFSHTTVLKWLALNKVMSTFIKLSSLYHYLPWLLINCKVQSQRCFFLNFYNRDWSKSQWIRKWNWDFAKEGHVFCQEWKIITSASPLQLSHSALHCCFAVQNHTDIENLIDFCLLQSLSIIALQGLIGKPRSPNVNRC